MSDVLHITSGDSAGGSLAAAGLPGEVFVWHDVLYDGPRRLGWPDADLLRERAIFIETITGGGLSRDRVLETFQAQYNLLGEAAPDRPIVLWFDACVFDQSMLAHVLACLRRLNATSVKLLCVDEFSGIEPYHGLGQLQADQLAGCYGDRLPVTDEQFEYAIVVDDAFAVGDVAALESLARASDAPLPWVPAAVLRWLKERPDPTTGLGFLASLVLDAVRSGCASPGKIFASVSAADTPPQYWGDTTLWAVINALAARKPPLVDIDGPTAKLPQWESDVQLDSFTIAPRHQ